MRKLYTLRHLTARGLSESAVRWGERQGRWRKVITGVYGDGPDDPSDLDRAMAVMVATGGTASGRLAGVLYELDGVVLRGPDVSLPSGVSSRRAGRRRRHLAPDRVVRVKGFACVSGLQVLLDLAPDLTDAEWEQALESALRKRLTTIADIEHAIPPRGRGVARIRRVLARRPPGAPPTESLLETLMVQLARNVPGLPDPVRQYVVIDANGEFVARVDLAWPDLGFFIELDGQQHKGQPIYDARRETAVVAATGWLCGRFTWWEVVHLPVTTVRRVAAVTEQARRRPLA